MLTGVLAPVRENAPLEDGGAFTTSFGENWQQQGESGGDSGSGASDGHDVSFMDERGVSGASSGQGSGGQDESGSGQAESGSAASGEDGGGQADLGGPGSSSGSEEGGPVLGGAGGSDDSSGSVVLGGTGGDAPLQPGMVERKLSRELSGASYDSSSGGPSYDDGPGGPGAPTLPKISLADGYGASLSPEQLRAADPREITSASSASSAAREGFSGVKTKSGNLISKSAHQFKEDERKFEYGLIKEQAELKNRKEDIGFSPHEELPSLQKLRNEHGMGIVHRPALLGRDMQPSRKAFLAARDAEVGEFFSAFPPQARTQEP